MLVNLRTETSLRIQKATNESQEGYASQNILILINIQHLQNIIFSFEIGSIGENISSSDYHHSMRISPSKISLVQFFPLALLHFCTPPPPFFIDDYGAEFHAD